VYSYLHSNGGKLTEDAAVKMILEPFLSGLDAIHSQARLINYNDLARSLKRQHIACSM
jgi:hypothetical protein